MEETSGDMPAPSEGGGGITGFLTSLRGVIAAVATLVIAVSGLLTALRATGVLDGDDEPTPTITTGEDGSDLFRAAKRTIADVYFERATMYVKAKARGAPFVHLAELSDNLGDVALSGRLEGPLGADFGAGFVCRHQGAGTYYLLSILSESRFVILRYRGRERTVLARGASSAIRDGANDVVARCLGERPTSLSLMVNGSTVASAQDAEGIASGAIGIRVGTNDPPATVRFDEVGYR
jgi:hypothetical protein